MRQQSHLNQVQMVEQKKLANLLAVRAQKWASSRRRSDRASLEEIRELGLLHKATSDGKSAPSS